jgi:hypothetical protein
MAAHATLFRRSTTAEPDAGLGQAYASGRLSLEARACASAWLVPDSVVEKARALIRLVDEVSDELVDEWVDLFPRAFLGTIERRHGRVEATGSFRRFVDRSRVSAFPLRASHV